MKPRIVPLGDSAVLVQLGDDIDLTINQRVHTLANLITTSAIKGIIETVPAYATLLVHYDLLVLSFTQIKSILREKLTQIQENESRVDMVQSKTRPSISLTWARSEWKILRNCLKQWKSF